MYWPLHFSILEFELNALPTDLPGQQPMIMGPTRGWVQGGVGGARGGGLTVAAEFRQLNSCLGRLYSTHTGCLENSVGTLLLRKIGRKKSSRIFGVFFVKWNLEACS